MSNIFSIRLSGPAKVGGLRRKAGDVVEIDQAGLDQLIAAGVVIEKAAALRAEGLVGADVLPVEPPGIDQTDFAALSEKLTLAEAEINHLGRELEIERLNSASLTGKLTLAEAEVNRLGRELEIARLKEIKTRAPGNGQTAQSGPDAPSTDTPPSEKAAKTAPKKGAAVNTKG